MSDETPAPPPADDTIVLPAEASAPEPAKKAGGPLWVWIVGTLVAVAAAVGVVAWLELSSGAPGAHPAEAASGAAAPSDARKIHVQLFYRSEDGSELVPVTREVAYGATTVEQARHILEAQVQPAPPGLSSAVPAGTSVRALFLTDHGDAYADLSAEVAAGHIGGSLDEALTVFAIVNALTVNLPSVTGVQILVDGKAVDTLAGHIDLRHPLGRSLKWVRKGM